VVIGVLTSVGCVQEAERLAEEERLRQEEEEQRKMEEEMNRLAEEARIAEEQRLLQAIQVCLVYPRCVFPIQLKLTGVCFVFQAAQKKEEEERKMKEEEARLKLEKEEAERKAKEEADRYVDRLSAVALQDCDLQSSLHFCTFAEMLSHFWSRFVPTLL